MKAIPPIGVNHLDFYKKCQREGVIMVSRYVGVCVRKGMFGSAPRWKAQYGNTFLSSFPLTEEGEKQARALYFKYAKTHGLKTTKRNKLK